MDNTQQSSTQILKQCLMAKTKKKWDSDWILNLITTNSFQLRTHTKSYKTNSDDNNNNNMKINH